MIRARPRRQQKNRQTVGYDDGALTEIWAVKTHRATPSRIGSQAERGDRDRQQSRKFPPNARALAALAVIGGHPDGIRPVELARHLGLTTAQTASAVDVLARRGLVTRHHGLIHKEAA